MEKRWRNAIFIIGLSCLFIGAIFYFSNNPDETGNIVSENKVYKTSEPQDGFSNVSKLHWGHMPVTYSIIDKENFYSLRLQRVGKALDEIEKLTNGSIRFKKVSENADISFVCNKEVKREWDGYFITYTLGEAELNNLSNLMTNATIYLYGGIDENCLDYPSIEMHEILHTLGIEHSKNAGSIMSEFEHYCLKDVRLDVDGKMFKDLENIYKQNSVI